MNSTKQQEQVLIETQGALKFITCGSVDDGKSTLIGRLLVDTKAVLQDHLAGVMRQGKNGKEVDLALLTDGLSAEREQGITIDVAYRYFATENRKFIIGDAPGHEQYTRNMVTAASSADAAVVLVDASKLDWQNPALELLPQTRRHSLLAHLLRVRSIVFTVNKLDAVENAELAFANISAALSKFATAADITVAAIVPISALKGWNVVDAKPLWAAYKGQSLLQILESLPTIAAETEQPFAFPVQWVEKPAPTLAASRAALPPEGANFPRGGSSGNSAEFSQNALALAQGRRVFWGRVATGSVSVGQSISILPSGQTATVAQVLDRARRPGSVSASQSAGIVLDREVDVSRGDWLLATNLEGQCAYTPSRDIKATIAWLDDEPLIAGRAYWALHGHRWVKAKIKRVVHKLDINTLAELEATQLEPNAIGHVEISLQEPIAAVPYTQSRGMGSLVLVDTASHKTAGAVLIS